MSTHDHVPDWTVLANFLIGEKRSPRDDRAFALYLAVLLIGQRTPEELATLADYLMTGTISEWRNG